MITGETEPGNIQSIFNTHLSTIAPESAEKYFELFSDHFDLLQAVSRRNLVSQGMVESLRETNPDLAEAYKVFEFGNNPLIILAVNNDYSESDEWRGQYDAHIIFDKAKYPLIMPDNVDPGINYPILLIEGKNMHDYTEAYEALPKKIEELLQKIQEELDAEMSVKVSPSSHLMQSLLAMMHTVHEVRRPLHMFFDQSVYRLVPEDTGGLVLFFRVIENDC